MGNNNIEIERKFLVNESEFSKLNFDLNSFEQCEIHQSYISVSPVIRIRKSNNDYILTIKGSGKVLREEFELKMDKEQYLSLLNKVEGHTISKTRYMIPLDNNLVAELDIYYEYLAGLKTVEVEFDSMAELNSFEPPKWFGEDVSNDSKYSNSSLAFIAPN